MDHSNNNTALDKLLKRSLIETDSYHNWLCNFSKKHPLFYDNQFNHILNLQKELYVKLFQLRNLFDLIHEYAKTNNILPCCNNNTIYYLFTSRNAKYNIGFKIIDDKEIHYFCERLDDKSLGSFINIHDIRINYYSDISPKVK